MKTINSNLARREAGEGWKEEHNGSTNIEFY